jgi:hypothetical protein
MERTGLTVEHGAVTSYAHGDRVGQRGVEGAQREVPCWPVDACWKETSVGCTTEFTGDVTITPPLNPHEIDYLQRFAETRHVHRTKGPYLAGGTDFSGSDIFDNNNPTPAYPASGASGCPPRMGTPSAGTVKRSSTTPSTGSPTWWTHSSSRRRIQVRDNTVYVVRLRTEPEFTDIGPSPDTWTDEQWAEFEARTRHNFVYVVHDGQRDEVGPADGTAFAPIPADGP